MLAEIMEFQLKPLSSETIPRALERAKTYRLLNEPEQAESICLDILRIDPDNQEVIVVLILALTDEFTHAERGTYTSAQWGYSLHSSNPNLLWWRLFFGPRTPWAIAL